MELRPTDILNLPAAPDFISEPPKFTASEMARMCESMLPHWNKTRYSKPAPRFVGEPFRLHPEDFHRPSVDGTVPSRNKLV
jgi:hypothetical protein